MSLLELLISTGITLVLTAGIFVVVNPVHATFQTQPELSDMQQRLRVAVDAIYQDLIAAGSGRYAGADAASLAIPAVLPMRRGLAGADPPGTFKSDTITLLRVPATAAQTTTSAPMAGTSAALSVNAQPGCPVGNPLCGFAAGMNILVDDDTGAYDTFTIANVDSAALTIAHTSDVSKAYGSGAHVTQVMSTTHWLNASQLMRYDGVSSDVAAADNIVSLQFEYYGDPQPPAPNCTVHVAGGPSLIKLDPASLADGPWCPDSLNANRWDADLLRIRKVFVTLSVRSALAVLHAADRAIRFEVAPRNLNLER